MSYSESNNYDESTTQIFIQGSDCGKIIGRGGTKIREIERLSQCSRIKVMQDDEGDGQRCVELTGSARAIKEAENMIKETLDSANSYNGDRGDRGFRNQSYSGYDGSRGGDEKKEVMQVDSDCVGRIIGRKGSRIQELQDNTGCSIRVMQDDEEDGQRCVELTGSARAIKEAENMIKETLDSANSYNGDRGDRGFRNQSYGGYDGSRGYDEKKEVMQVDSDCVGRIIGKKGSRIQELQDYTGCNIRINSDRGGYDKTDVDLVGSSRAIDAAKKEILKITSYSSYSSY